MSGEMLRPKCSKSSPVLATISNSSGGRTRLRPSASLAPPTPPDSATTRPPLIESSSSPELVLARRPDQLGRRVGGRLPGQPTDQHDGLRFVALAHHQRGGGGDLVGKAGDSDLQGSAEQVVIAAHVQ